MHQAVQGLFGVYLALHVIFLDQEKADDAQAAQRNGVENHGGAQSHSALAEVGEHPQRCEGNDGGEQSAAAFQQSEHSPLFLSGSDHAGALDHGFPEQ